VLIRNASVCINATNLLKANKLFLAQCLIDATYVSLAASCVYVARRFYYRLSQSMTC